MNRSEKNALAERLREIIEKLRAAPERCKKCGEEAEARDRARGMSGGAKYPHAFGGLEVCVTSACDELEALIKHSLEHGRGRK